MTVLSRKQGILLLVVAFQFALVVIGAGRLVYWPNYEPVGRWLSFYSELSGASSGYGFFAPGVGSQLRARFEVVQGDGVRKEVSIETHNSHESDLRVGNIIGRFWDEGTDIRLKRTMAASWAGKIFGRHPDATEVIVRLESYRLVSMEDYRNGKRPDWEKFYEGKFEHKARKEKLGGR